MNEITRVEEEVPIAEGEPLQGLPSWARVTFTVLATGVLVMCAILILAYIRDPQNVASPKELQLSTVILSSLSILFLALVPWHKLGLRIRKIGAIEFETVVNAQAREHAEEFAELRVRIDELEEKVRGSDDVSPLTEHFALPTLRPLVLDFLSKFQPTAYSPLRIRDWGARQQGFEHLKDYEVGMIRRAMQSLVAEGKVATRVSRLGNTLYKVAD